MLNEPAVEDGVHPAVRRLLGDGSIDAAGLDALRSGLSGADLTAVLLDAMAHRAAAFTPADLVRRYEGDRFVQPAPVDARRLLSLSAAAVDAIADDFGLIDTSPVVPLGTSSVVSGISQNRVVSTARSTEVVSDPTNALALEAARRRSALLGDDPRSAAPVRLATVGRILRAQRFDGPRSFQHFTLLGLVTAGRDTGGLEFETSAVVEHLGALVAACRASGHDAISIELTDFDGAFGETIERAIAALAERAGRGVTVTTTPDRPAGRGYYPSICFKLAVEHEGESIEVGDGGLVPWTQTLVGSRKERLMVSALSLERLATL